ncbi:MAG TPA: tetratricopeptide repeat protein [bacterium]|nr:tetratricopeptide repeat protein [bacterium]
MKIRTGIIFLFIFFSAISIVYSNPADKDFFDKGMNFYYLNNLKDALSNFSDAVKTNPNNSQYRFYLGKTLFKLKEYQKAIKELETALSLKEPSDEIIRFLAESYFTIQEWQKALKMYGILSEKFPNEFEIHFKLGQLFFVQDINDLNKARKHFDIALKLAPLNPYVRYFIGRIYLKQNQFPEAISEFDKAVSSDPSNGLFYYWRGNAHYAQMDFYNPKDEHWKSDDDFRKSMELGFDQAQTYFMFANTCLNRGLYYMNNNREADGVELLKSSTNYYRKVIILQPDASNAFNNLGLAYLGLNKIQESILAFKKAIEIEPTVSFFHNNLGDAYFKLGNFKDSITEWELALELEPDPDNIRSSLFGDKRNLRDKIRDAERRQ